MKFDKKKLLLFAALLILLVGITAVSAVSDNTTTSISTDTQSIQTTPATISNSTQTVTTDTNTKTVAKEDNTNKISNNDIKETNKETQSIKTTSNTKNENIKTTTSDNNQNTNNNQNTIEQTNQKQSQQADPQTITPKTTVTKKVANDNNQLISSNNNQSTIKTLKNAYNFNNVTLFINSFRVPVNSKIQLKATVKYTNGTPVNRGNIQFFTDNLDEYVEVHNGIASINYTTSSEASTQVITISYRAPGDTLSDSNYSTITTYSPLPTFTLVNGASTIPKGKVKIEASVYTKDYTLVKDGTVTFSILVAASANGNYWHNYTANVINGRASINYTTSNEIGEYDVIAKYNGDVNKEYAPSESTGSIYVINGISTYTTVNPIYTSKNSPVVISATVKDSNNSLISSGTVTFEINNKIIGIVEIYNNVASITYNTPNYPGNYTINARYNGNNKCFPSNGSNILYVSNKTDTQVNINSFYASANSNILINASIKNNYNSSVSAGTVTFEINGKIIGTTTINKGIASIKYNTSKTAGDYIIYVKYNGINGYSPSNNTSILHVIYKNTHTKVNYIVAPLNTTILLTATVNDSHNLPLNYGYVTFEVNHIIIGNINVTNGTAVISYTTPNKAVKYPIKATYNGSGIYYNSINNNVLRVENTIIPTALYINPIITSTNNKIQLNTTIKDYYNNLIPLGTVQFLINNKLIGSSNVSNGTATITYNTLGNIGKYNLEVKYINGNTYRNSKNSTTLTLKNINTILYINSINSTINSKIQLNTTVNDDKGNLINTGTVRFRINGATIGLANVTNGIATLNYYTPKTPGNYTIQAIYNGNGYVTSQKSIILENTAQSRTITNINPINASISTKIQLNATVNDIKGNNINTGTVRFRINGATISIVNVNNGLATLNYYTPRTPGNYTIIATYSGDNNYTSSQSNTILINTPLKTTITYINPINASVSTKIQLNATIKDSNGNLLNEGTVRFRINGATISLANVINGVATLNYCTPRTPGNYTITATYSGSNNYATSQSNTILTNIRSTTIKIDPIDGVYVNTKIELFARVTDNSNDINEGTVRFSINGATINVLNVTDGFVIFEYYTPRTPGNYTITATYSGSNNYATSQNTIILENKALITSNNIKTSIKTAEPTTTYDWYVSTDGTGDGSTYNTPTTITNAFTNAQTGQSIFIKDGTYNLTSTITINKNINITGESITGTILSGQSAENTYTQIMIINKRYTATISNITFINGEINSSISSGYGGAILSNGTLNVYNCSFMNNKVIATGNEVDAHGGAIYNKGTSTIVDCSFINNTVLATEYLRDAYGGSIYNWGTLNITSCSFVNNTATATGQSSTARGGAIDNSGTLKVISSIFINNTATTKEDRYAWGGAIYNEYESNSLTVNYNVLINNKDSAGREIYSNNVIVTSLDYNWWGQNITNYQISPDTLGLTNCGVSEVLYLNITSLPNEWTYNAPLISITANLINYNIIATGTISNIEGSLLPKSIPITFTITPDTMTFTSQETVLSNGVATAIFKPKTIGTVTVTANIYSNNTSLTKRIAYDTIYVNATSTITGTGKDWTSPVQTIEEALNIVPNGGKIILAEGTYDVSGDYGLIIPYNVAIIGQTENNVIIDGLNDNQIMKINNGSIVNITNITFTNGKITTNNTSTSGGAISNSGTLNINNCNFIKNTVTITSIGTDYSYGGGGAIYNNGTLNISNSNFIANSVMAIGQSSIARGGAIYNNVGILNVIGSTFINNTATKYGGAIYNEYGSILTVNYNILINNSDSTRIEIYNNNYGGKIKSLDYNWWGQNTTNYQISPNNLGLTNFPDKIKWLYFNITSTPYIWTGDSNVLLTANLKEYFNGSITGILTDEESEKLPQNVPVTFTTTKGIVTPTETILINGITTTTYTPKTTGTVTVTANIYSNNTSLTKKIIYNIVYVNATSTIIGTGKDWTSPVQTIEEALNIVPNGGKIILAEGTYDVSGDYGLIIPYNVAIIGQTENNVIIDGLNDNQIMKINNGSIVNITNITFTNGKITTNNTSTSGGAISNSGTLNINNCNFIKNTVTILAIGRYSYGGGGAIYNNGTLNITTCNFINNIVTNKTETTTGNYSSIFGGAIYNDAGTLNVNECNFINNTAKEQNNFGGGGAIASIDGSSTITICNFVNNKVTAIGKDISTYGGAIYNTNSTLILNDSNLINNTAVSIGNDSEAFGGAIYNDHSIVKVNNCSLINNTVRRSINGECIYAVGGAIYNAGTLDVTTCNFINNKVTYEEREVYLSNYGGSIYNAGTLTANYNIFLSNANPNEYEVYNGGTINSLDYNWWGQNTTNYQRTPFNDNLLLTNYHGDKLTTWLYLNMTSSLDNWTYNVPTLITVNLTGYVKINIIALEIRSMSLYTLTDKEVDRLPQNIPVTFTATNGIITPTETTLTKGITTSIFTPTVAEGVMTVTTSIYNNTTSITHINKMNTEITITNINGTTKENITINAIVTSNGNRINTGTVTFMSNYGSEQTVNVVNGIAIFNTSYTKPGNYTITAVYNENDFYKSSQTTAIATITSIPIIIKHNVTMDILVKSSSTMGITFNITIKDTNGTKVTNGCVYIFDYTKTYGIINVDNGTVNYKCIFDKAGNYTMVVKYNSTSFNDEYITFSLTIRKSNTTVLVNPIIGTIGDRIILQANITDQYNNKVTDGQVVFKINGNTLKDTNNNVIYTNVTDGIATLQYIIPNSLSKNNLTIQAIYSGTDDIYNPSRNINIINVTKRTAIMNLTFSRNPVKAADSVIFQAILQDINGTTINNGVVVFKFNGKTIRDINRNTIKVNITNGQAILNYTIPNGISARNYNITAVLGNNNYNRLETTAILTTEKINSTIIINPTTTTRGSNTTLLNGTIKDTNGNLMTGTHKIAVRLNGKFMGIYYVKNGIINTNITIPNTLRNKNYNITVKIGNTNGYYGTNTTTTLTINSTKVLKQKVSI